MREAVYLFIWGKLDNVYIYYFCLIYNENSFMEKYIKICYFD